MVDKQCHIKACRDDVPVKRKSRTKPQRSSSPLLEYNQMKRCIASVTSCLQTVTFKSQCLSKIGRTLLSGSGTVLNAAVSGSGSDINWGGLPHATLLAAPGACVFYKSP
ncbi:hypothetical protein RRG08_051041 [Elysia crispata]|uniref:Uncharacterized protein n=1 Tax=Elysia crispata TaxID=231223 RepID=A0AAE0Z507_9GAST|nr:hypothetical protein RRG08_051041 [Elysia crispata]